MIARRALCMPLKQPPRRLWRSSSHSCKMAGSDNHNNRNSPSNNWVNPSSGVNSLLNLRNSLSNNRGGASNLRNNPHSNSSGGVYNPRSSNHPSNRRGLRKMARTAGMDNGGSKKRLSEVHVLKSDESSFARI